MYMKTDNQPEQIEYKSRGEVRKQAANMLAELTELNNRIVNGAFELQPTERLLCRQYLDFTLKYAPSLKTSIRDVIS